MFLENILGNPEIHKEMQRAKNNWDSVEDEERGGNNYQIRILNIKGQ